MTKIIIKRSSEYLNKFRNYKLYIDDKEIATVANGKSITLDVAAGNHSIYAKIDWCSSPTLSFDIREAEIKTFKVSGYKNGNWMMPLAFIIVLVSVLASLLFDADYIIYFALPFFLISMYYITFGRKQYLTLKEQP